MGGEDMEQSLTVAVFGDVHGRQIEMYQRVAQFHRPIDWVLQVGDFETHRDMADVASKTGPEKYRVLGQFPELVTRGQAPVPTLFIGGNHEAYRWLDAHDAGFTFPLSFKEICSLTGNMPISVIASWMGKFREIVLEPIQRQLLSSFAEGFGAVTNRSSIRMCGTTQAMDIIEGRQWLSTRSAYDRSFMVMAFDWMKILPDGRSERIAASEVEVTWVRITGRGTAEVAPIPAYFLTFLCNLGMHETGSDDGAVVQSILWEHAAGKLLYHAPAGPRLGLPLLWTRQFETSLEQANLIGNIYYTNYYVWSGQVRDQYLYQLMPAYYENQGRSGELYCIDARMEHLQEAMPFETVSASMYLAGLYENEVRLYFEFYSTAPDGEQRKLAYSDQTLVWIVPDPGTQTVVRAPLPQHLIDGLLRVVFREGHSRAVTGGDGCSSAPLRRGGC